MTYALIFFLSINTPLSSAGYGGPATIQGFETRAACEAAAQKVSKVRGFDWATCIEVEIPAPKAKEQP